MRHLILALSSLFFFACQSGVDDSVYALEHSSDSTAAKTFELSEEEFIDFALRIESSFMNDQGTLFDAHFDINELLDYALEGSGLTPREMRQAKSEIKPDMLSSQIVEMIGMDGSFYLINHKIYDNYATATYRLHSPEGYNYHILYVQTKDGKPVIYDDFIFTTGERFSFSLKQIYRRMFSSMNNGRSVNGEAILKLEDALQQNDPQKALELIEALPDEFKDDKIVKVLAIQAAGQVNDEQYRRTMEQYDLEGDSLDLLLIDLYLLKGDYEKTLSSIDRLDAAVGGDEYLDILRANTYILMDDFEQATNTLQGHDSVLVEFEDFYWVKLAISIHTNHYDAATPILDDLTSRYGYGYADMHEYLLMEYPEFAASDIYREWYTPKMFIDAEPTF